MIYAAKFSNTGTTGAPNFYDNNNIFSLKDYSTVKIDLKSKFYLDIYSL
jgi:hypothetical protein